MKNPLELGGVNLNHCSLRSGKVQPFIELAFSSLIKDDQSQTTDSKPRCSMPILSIVCALNKKKVVLTNKIGPNSSTIWPRTSPNPLLQEKWKTTILTQPGTKILNTAFRLLHLLHAVGYGAADWAVRQNLHFVVQQVMVFLPCLANLQEASY